MQTTDLQRQLSEALAGGAEFYAPLHFAEERLQIIGDDDWDLHVSILNESLSLNSREWIEFVLQEFYGDQPTIEAGRNAALEIRELRSNDPYYSPDDFSKLPEDSYTRIIFAIARLYWLGFYAGQNYEHQKAGLGDEKAKNTEVAS